MRARRPNLNDAQRKWVRDWWLALQPRVSGGPQPKGELSAFDRGTRARLRRCTDAEAVMTQPAAMILARGLIQRGGDRWPVPNQPATYGQVGLVAGVLAYLKADSEKHQGLTLALHLGKPNESGRPVMSEVRFQRLQRARSIDDLFLQWQRAVQMVTQADVAQLADDLLTWLAELGPSVIRPTDSVKFRWAHDYYLATKPADLSAGNAPVSDEEMTA